MAHEFEQATAEPVGAGSGGDIDKRRRFAAELGWTVMQDGKIVGKPGDGLLITPLR